MTHPAIENLRTNQRQLDMDGCEVGVSRQAVVETLAEIDRLNAWVADLQSGMFVNCVYCGHRYGPGETTPVSMADALKAHVATCSEHPMAKLRSALEKLVGQLDRMADVKGIEPATWLCLIELNRQGREALRGCEQ